VLPLAFVMIAGPQIISAVFLATSVEWRRNSAAYLAGAALSITLFVTAIYFIAKGLKSSAGSSHKGSANDGIDIAILVVLVLLAVRVFLKRHEAEPPKWMGRLERADPKFSFKLGFLLLGVFPTDIATTVTVGAYLARHGDPWWHALPFIAVTLLLLALPALLLLMFGRRAEAFLPKARQWMNENSWVINELVFGLFIALQINSLAGD
jgi:Sap, sulfolipid-1-addressing protein